MAHTAGAYDITMVTTLIIGGWLIPHLFICETHCKWKLSHCCGELCTSIQTCWLLVDCLLAICNLWTSSMIGIKWNTVCSSLHYWGSLLLSVCSTNRFFFIFSEEAFSTNLGVLPAGINQSPQDLEQAICDKSKKEVSFNCWNII